ncbi:MAG: hypothetical protein EOM16_00990 [Bacteroidia bacterium]|nr:hypothetical protein [Bacteroidia bacterium]
MSAVVLNPAISFTTIVAKDAGEPSSADVTVPVTLICAKAVLEISRAKAKNIVFLMYNKILEKMNK